MTIHVPAQRTAPDTTTAPAAVVAGPVELGWRALLRRTVARAALAMVASLVMWSLLPALVGMAPHVIMSGSMEPRIHVGDIIVTREVPPATLVKGNVITVEDPDHPEKTRTHRFVRRAADGTIVTRGDANPEADSSHVTDAAVLGLGVIRVPFVGRAAYWMAERNYAALGVTFLLLGWCVVSAFPGRPKVEESDEDSNGSGPGSRPGSRPRADRTSRRRRIAAAATVGVVAVGALGAPADAAFKKNATNTTSTWSAAGAFVVSYAQTVLADSPQFYWRLDEASGSTAADAGKGRTGQVSGSWSWGQGGALASQRSSTALRIDGGYINQPVSLTSGTAFSVEAWFRTTRTSGGPLLSLITSSGVERSLYLGTDGKVRFGRNGNALVTSPGALNDGQWHHVVYTNASSGSVRARLYADGSQVAAAATGVTSSGVGNWRAGQAQWSGNWAGGPDQFFRGDLDEVAVYGSALSASRVAQHQDAAN